MIISSACYARVNNVREKSTYRVDYSWQNNNDFEIYEERLDKKLSESSRFSRPKKLAAYKPEYKKKERKKTSVKYKKSSASKKFKNYVVKNGDTLYGISRKFKVSSSEICSKNGIKNKNKIKKGLVLKIPLEKGKACSYAIKKEVEKDEIARKNSPDFIWPMEFVDGYRKDEFNGIKSIGIIISGRQGSSIMSSADGVVKKIGWMRGFGNYVVVKHKDRYASVYSKLDSIVVNEGDLIKSGFTIGRIEKSSNEFHFQIDYAGKPENPLIYLPKKIAKR